MDVHHGTAYLAVKGNRKKYTGVLDELRYRGRLNKDFNFEQNHKIATAKCVEKVCYKNN